MSDDRTPGYDEPDRDELNRPLTLAEWDYLVTNEQIPGVADESCGVCGKPRSQDRRHDRDHDHRTGNPRGLACPGNTGCNVLMLPWVSALTARAIASSKKIAREPDAERWALIAAYLDRVERFYGAAV